jgi:Asp-tRNA(Asn)/Glu-tRNA(Gln) amidotransferase A subunit family amidase
VSTPAADSSVDLDLAYLPATEMAERIARDDLSPVDVVGNALARIDEVQERLNCFCFIYPDEALEQARAAQFAVQRGRALGPLHGVPIALKDTTPTAGRETIFGSWTHDGWIPERSAAIVGALERAGAIVVGKTTSPEFAHASITWSPRWGATRNPWDLSRSTGGSSGGSAAAVAAGCVPLAEGSDMGGSVRIPAAWCGVVGLKPGFGRIPMDGLPGLFDSLSHHGPLARTVDDAALFLDVTQGPDDADILSLPTPLAIPHPMPDSVDGLRLALSIDLGCWAVDPDIRDCVERAASLLRERGATVDVVEVEVTPRDEEVWEQLWEVFMAAYFGDLLDDHRHHMDPAVVRLIEGGQAISAVTLKRLEIERTGLWERFRPVFARYDALICPTMATAPSAAEPEPRQAHPPLLDAAGYHASEMTAPFNLLAPCPAMSVPGGLDGHGLPIGVQIVGRRWREDTVLRVGKALESALPSPAIRPPL